MLVQNLDWQVNVLGKTTKLQLKSFWCSGAFINRAWTFSKVGAIKEGWNNMPYLDILSSQCFAPNMSSDTANNSFKKHK